MHDLFGDFQCRDWKSPIKLRLTWRICAPASRKRSKYSSRYFPPIISASLHWICLQYCQSPRKPTEIRKMYELSAKTHKNPYIFNNFVVICAFLQEMQQIWEDFRVSVQKTQNILIVNEINNVGEIPQAIVLQFEAIVVNFIEKAYNMVQNRKSLDKCRAMLQIFENQLLQPAHYVINVANLRLFVDFLQKTPDFLVKSQAILKKLSKSYKKPATSLEFLVNLSISSRFCVDSLNLFRFSSADNRQLRISERYLSRLFLSISKISPRISSGAGPNSGKFFI